MKVGFVGDAGSSFVKADLDILRKHHEVVHVALPNGKSDWLRYIAEVRKVSKDADAFVSWFANYHSAVTAFYAKKSIVIIGGYDSAKVPEINYGAFMTMERYGARYAYRWSDKAVAVDPSLLDGAVRYGRCAGHKLSCLPTGYDSERFIPNRAKERIVLTVCPLNGPSMLRKGIYTYLKVASLMPDITFYLVGKDGDQSAQVRATAPKNVVVTGFIEDDALLELYQRAQCYCQLSRFEGLPNALCEAMLCECVPVGTRYNGIVTAMGEHGSYVEYNDAEGTARAVREAMFLTGAWARKRVRLLFPLDVRESGLLRLLKEM